MLLKVLHQMIDGKKVLLLGFGREGRALYRRITEVGGYQALGISDANPLSDAPKGVSLHIGADYQAAMTEYDIVFKVGVVGKTEYG